jgi:hypothetical protein
MQIEAQDWQGLERLLRYCACWPFAADRLEEIDAQRLIYHLPKPDPDGRTQLILSPRELASAASPRRSRHPGNSGTATTGFSAPTRRCARRAPPWRPRPWRRRQNRSRR